MKKTYRARLKYKTEKERGHISKVIEIIRKLGAAKCLDLLTQDKDRKQYAPLAVDDDGKLMSIRKYCDKNGLDFRMVKNYRLIQHTGLPIYNISFYQSAVPDGLGVDDVIKAVREEIRPAKISPTKPTKGAVTDFLWFSDVHIGMECNPDKSNNFPHRWDDDVVRESFAMMAAERIHRKRSESLVVCQLGDLLDGFNKKTTRGGHELPQNMTNRDSFILALEMLKFLMGTLAEHYDSITFHNVCNDNHAGDFGFFACESFRVWAESKHPQFKVFNHITPLAHFEEQGHVFIIGHGKDKEHQKRGLPTAPQDAHINLVDRYLKNKKLYKYKHRHFCKGDSHQAIFNMSKSPDFTWNNYPTLAPPSSYIQANFVGSKRGFVLEEIEKRWEGLGRREGRSESPGEWDSVKRA